MAEVSVSEAIWSITTRRRAAAEDAVSQAGRNTGSSVCGAPIWTVAASSAMSSRSRACAAAAPFLVIT